MKCTALLIALATSGTACNRADIAAQSRAGAKSGDKATSQVALLVDTSADLPACSAQAGAMPATAGQVGFVSALDKASGQIYACLQIGAAGWGWKRLDVANGAADIISPGAKGDKGDQGAIGVAGAAGAEGAQGPVGAAGAQGLAGAAGVQGAQGTPGAQGIPGVAAPDAFGADAGAPADSVFVSNAGDVALTGAITAPTLPTYFVADRTLSPTAHDYVEIGSFAANAGFSNNSGYLDIVATSHGPVPGFSPEARKYTVQYLYWTGTPDQWVVVKPTYWDSLGFNWPQWELESHLSTTTGSISLRARTTALTLGGNSLGVRFHITSHAPSDAIRFLPSSTTGNDASARTIDAVSSVFTAFNVSGSVSQLLIHRAALFAGDASFAGYVQLAGTTGAPAAGDCAAGTRGRMKFDAAAGTLYVCAASGWISK